MAPSRKPFGNANSQFPSNRVVTIKSGGLNERFNSMNQPSGGSIQSRLSSASVFSRIRGAGGSQGGRGSSNIQSRLGRTQRGGIQKRTKRNGPAPMEGVESTTPNAGRGRRRGGAASAATTTRRGGSRPTNVKAKRGRGGRRGGPDRRGGPQRKKATSEDLDKALDAYMMKDPKVAQTKLDAELDSYMADAPNDDIDMS